MVADEFAGEDRAAPAAGAQRAAVVRDSDRLRLGRQRAGVRGGDTVVVIGVGGIGTGAIQGARISGAAQIVAVDPVDFKQKSALQFGATHSAATVAEALDLVRDLTYGVMADAVVVSPSLDHRGRRARCGEAHPQGRNLRADRHDLADDSVGQDRSAGLHPDEQDAGRHHIRLVQPEGGHLRLARLYQTGQLQLDEMITRRYRLDDINNAYDDLRNGKIIRGIIDFGID